MYKRQPYSSAEILWVQMGCAAQGLDGAYAERYADLLARALFSDPFVFARALATEGVAEQTKYLVLLNTAYGTDLYPAELNTALNTLDGYSSAFTDTERAWAELLQLYLVTPANERSELQMCIRDRSRGGIRSANISKNGIFCAMYPPCLSRKAVR